MGGLQVEEPPDPYDYTKIHKHIMGGRTYGSRVKGRFRIVSEDKNGKVTRVYDDNEMTLARIPTPVYDRSFVVAGKKRHLVNQFRRKPGVFTLQDAKGDYITEFNVDQSSPSRVKNFRIQLDQSDDAGPDFNVVYGTAKKIPAWDMAKLLGATDGELRKAVGKASAEAMENRSSQDRYERTVRQLHSSIFGGKEAGADLTHEQREAEVREQFTLTAFDPTVMKAVTGLKTGELNKDVILNSFTKLKRLANEEIEPDDRESLALKRILSPADLLAESVGRDREVQEYRRYLSGQLRKARNLARKDPDKVNVLQVVGTKLSPKINSRLTSSMLQRSDTATNPMDNWANANLTTIMGEGAIQSDKAVPVDAKLINASHLGFLDPTHTPESDKAGVALHHTARARVVPDTRPGAGAPDTGASRLVSTFLDKKGTALELSPDELVGKTIGAFDQMEIRRGRPTAKLSRVKAFKDGKPVEVRPSDIDFWMPDPLSMFDAQSALIPFANSTQGNRAGFSAKQGAQAVPLVNREAPLVQIKLPNSDYSLEEVLGEEAGAIRAKFDGEVVEIKEGGPGERTLVVKRKGSRKTEEIPLPKDLPMGGNTPLDSEVRLTPGDKFKAGDVLADSTFTKDGVLAMGTNVRVAYMPHYANTFEDAVAISERMAGKMRSQHLYTVDIESDQVRLGKSAYRSRGAPLPTEQDKKLGSQGVVQVGQRINPGDPLFVGVKGIALGDRDLQEKLALIGQFSARDRRKLMGQTQAFTQIWREEKPGEVVAVDVKKGRDGKVKGARVVIKTDEPMQAGDKIYGRHGNKGVVSTVISNDSMPFLPGRMDVVDPADSPFRKGQEISEEEAAAAEKKYPGFKASKAHVDLILNPLGVAGRLNPSQNYETLVSRVAAKEGTPEKVQSFGYVGEDSNWDFVDRRLKEAGLDADSELVLPETGRRLQNMGVGYQYIQKAKQTVSKKNSARGLGTFQKNGLVARGEDGARALGELGVYGLLAQDAREFLRDAQLYKSENREHVWRALRQGRPIGDTGMRVNDEPRAFKRLLTYLQAAGVEPVHDQENFTYRLRPQTDADVIKLTQTNTGSGPKDRVFTAPTQTVDAKGRPRAGGLFDPSVTGGMNGNHWGRFELAEPVPNPIYESAIQDLLNMKPAEYADVLAGNKSVEIDERTYTGSRAIQRMLESVDVGAAFEEAKAQAKGGARDSDRSRGYRKMRSIQMLKDNNMTPTQAFMRKQVPVVPTQLRTIDVDEKGQVVVGDLNYLYRDIALTNEELQEAKKRGLPPRAIGQLEAGLYESMRTLMQVQGSKPLSPSAQYQGVLGTLIGKHPDGTGDVKSSLFKKEVFQRRQTFSGGAVLAADDKLGIDQASIPKTVMAALVEGDIEAEWNRSNPNAPQEQRQKFLKKLKDYHQLGVKDPEVETFLRRAAKKRQVVVKRDPVLHKYGIQAFEPVLSDRKTIGLNPMVFGGFNADSDGDVLGIFVPLTEEANREAKEKLRPSKNLFNPSSGALEYSLGHEAILGIARATRNPRVKTNKTFVTLQEAEKAWEKGDIEADHEVSIGGRKTTVGRELFSRALPAGTDFDDLRSKGVITDKDLDVGVSKKGGNLHRVLKHMALEHTPAYGESANALRQLGQKVATYSGASLTLNDLRPMLREERQRTGAQLRKELDAVRSKRGLSFTDKQREVENVFAKHIRSLGVLQDRGWNQMVAQERPSTLPELVLSGARATPDQLKQMLSAPVALVDGKNQVVDQPVMRNYSEGLEVTDYWTAASGARMGAINKVVQVREPGYLTKQIVNTAIDQVITEEDCGTKKYVELNANDTTNTDDLVGRVLTNPIKVGGLSLNKGHVLSQNDVAEMQRKLKGDEPFHLRVRSPMRCQATQGVCQKCAGHDAMGAPLRVGTNIGIQSAQALGERSTQLTLSTFHGGGVFSPDGGSAANLYNMAQNLLRMPSSMGGKAAVVAKGDGTIKKVKKNSDKGGWDIITKEDDAPNIFIPMKYRAPWESKRQDEDRPQSIPDFYKPGMIIRRGDVLTDGMANPKDIMAATEDVGAVQDYMSTRLHNLFAQEGIMRRNVETVVKSMTDAVEVADGGDSPFLPGQRIGRQEAEKGQGLFKNFKFRPIIRGVDVMPREKSEDWLAKLNFNHLRDVIQDAAQTGAASSYHSTNPIPALAVGREFNRPPAGAGGRGVY
jgi:DNA-directed RNA polymerase subunit beta'